MRGEFHQGGVAQQAPALLEPALAAYTSGLNVAAMISAVGFLVLAATVAVMLRSIPSVGAAQAAAADGEQAPQQAAAPDADEDDATDRDAVRGDAATVNG